MQVETNEAIVKQGQNNGFPPTSSDHKVHEPGIGLLPGGFFWGDCIADCFLMENFVTMNC
jgi:hypothetical protein